MVAAVAEDISGWVATVVITFGVINFASSVTTDLACGRLNFRNHFSCGSGSFSNDDSTRALQGLTGYDRIRIGCEISVCMQSACAGSCSCYP